MKQFDDIFRENVKKVFGSYSTDYLADEGWNSFLERKECRRGFITVIPFLAKAASVLLMAGLGTFFIYRLSTQQAINEVLSTDKITAHDACIQSLDNEAAKPAVMVPAPLSAGSDLTVRSEKFMQADVVVQSGGDSQPEHATPENKSIIFYRIAVGRFLEPVIQSGFPFQDKLIASYLHISSGRPVTEVMETTSRSLGEGSNAGEVFRQVKNHGGRTFIAGLSGLLIDGSRSVNISSGVLAGFYVDQKVTKRISLRPGLALTMQSLGFANGNGNIYASSPSQVLSAEAAGGKLCSFEGAMNMLAVEVPLNIIFRVGRDGSSGLFLSAGTSSLFYLSQQFTADYGIEYTRLGYNATTDESFTESRFTNVGVEKKFGSLSRIDFFGLVGFSTGYLFPYGKTGSVLVEPFFQFPVRNLTSLNLGLKYGGISVKFCFDSQKREKH